MWWDRKLQGFQITRAVRMYRTNGDACRALGVSGKTLSILCRRYGIETPAERNRRERRGVVGSSTMKTEDVYSASEAASLLGVSRRTVRHWIDQGRIHRKYGGRAWRIPQSEVDRVRTECIGELSDTGAQISFDHQVTQWGTKKELKAATHQLERHGIPYVWRYRNGKWAIFRSFARQDGLGRTVSDAEAEA